MKKILLSAILLSSIIACREESLSNRDAQLQAQQNLLDVKSVYKQEFSIALAKALASNADLRDFIKKEALKKFDNDYDVLYQMIKDQMIGGKAFKDIIAEQYDKKENLEALERLYPTLTIFVPELPMDSFSAEKWNSRTEIPQVAYTLDTTNDIPVVNEKGEEYFLEAKYAPSFPVVVVKENERVKISTNSSVRNNTIASVSVNAPAVIQDNVLKGNSYNFEFLDDAFNGNKSNKILKSASVKAMSTIANTSLVDSKLQQAYEIYKNTDGWQRDYIYYDITPGQQRGQFKYDFQEHLTSFKMNDANGLAIISDQTGDPKNNSRYQSEPGSFLGWSNLPRSSWTGGAFEFKVHVLINATNGIGSSIDKYFSVSPNDLYMAEYVPDSKLKSSKISGKFWELKSIIPKEVPLSLQLFNWDLNQYASSIKISIEEVDLTEEETRTDTRSVKFATNFSIDPTDGFLKKMGLKFGSSLERNESSTVTYKVTKSSDQLGDVIVNFADNAITSFNGSIFTKREYNSGLYTITVEPRRVQ
ncbi:hypothetical protein HZQ19_08280 [Elizabethkingia anophelis]|uniref:hypothetical protein n=1 Tax=Elizabethkingia anophelis TaxID=1117645 RepID=UPI000C9AB1A9|nr:hypothetical protein [Elizabethkingia anophelis]MCT3758586.1 hypothetical protein [Elizabethkingia anophelis]MCT3898200.1 hypothetical protein [Elizabethkingia anophelis]MCT3973890.1 hypothetical protein [Elizabethkingia anophelis]MCT4001867.1 hypothetical protein [Elizabethkingia anophelis]MCT4016082.1 hypothetical protein [Elizabethkingia anophelis]